MNIFWKKKANCKTADIKIGEQKGCIYILCIYVYIHTYRKNILVLA